MSRALLFGTVLMTLATGCYTAEEKVTTIRFDDESGLVRIDETYHGLHSDASEDDTKGAKADFDQLIDDWRSDKIARLWVEGDRLHGMRQRVWGADDYFSSDSSRWKVDSTGFYYHRTDSIVTTNGAPMGAGRWHWPPDTRIMVVREQPYSLRGAHWHSEFASWYGTYVAQRGLDEDGMSPGPVHGGRVLVNPAGGLGLPLGPTASLSAVISLAKDGFESQGGRWPSIS